MNRDASRTTSQTKHLQLGLSLKRLRRVELVHEEFHQLHHIGLSERLIL
jgi:hypothetical protein